MPSNATISRSEKIGDYAKLCGRVRWREERIASGDGVPLAVCRKRGGVEGEEEDGGYLSPGVCLLRFLGFFFFFSWPSLSTCITFPLSLSQQRKKRNRKDRNTDTPPPNLTNNYHRNGSSIPPRLPSLSSILTLLTSSTSPPSSPAYTFLALSYRRYWTSSGRPSEKGPTLDALSILSHARITYPSSTEQETRFVLWGQSLGAGVAIAVLAAEAEAEAARDRIRTGRWSATGNAVYKCGDMLKELYPQK